MECFSDALPQFDEGSFPRFGMTSHTAVPQSCKLDRSLAPAIPARPPPGGAAATRLGQRVSAVVLEEGMLMPFVISALAKAHRRSESANSE